MSCRWYAGWSHTNTADGETIPHDADALRLDSSRLFFVARTAQCCFEVKGLVRGVGALCSHLLDIGRGSLVLAALPALDATQAAREVAGAGKLFGELGEIRLGTLDVDAVGVFGFLWLGRVARGALAANRGCPHTGVVVCMLVAIGVDGLEGGALGVLASVRVL